MLIFFQNVDANLSPKTALLYMSYKKVKAKIKVHIRHRLTFKPLYSLLGELYYWYVFQFDIKTLRAYKLKKN